MSRLPGCSVRMKTGFTGSAGRYLLAISAFALLAVFIGAGCKSNDNGFVYTKFKQYYDGQIIHEGDINCVFIGGKMIYAEGLLVAIDKDRTLTTNCVDILSILVRENGRVSAEEKIERTIVSIENGLSFVKASREKYYLVPTYRIVYSDNTESVYDAVTGDYLG